MFSSYLSIRTNKYSDASGSISSELEKCIICSTTSDDKGADN